jgi:hypothetical protein
VIGRTRIGRLIAATLALGAGGLATAVIATGAGRAPAALADARAGSAAMMAAAGPSIRVDRGCYEVAQKAPAKLKGTGFDPNAHWAATLNGSKFGSGTTDAKGDITATFGVPIHLLSRSTGEDSYKLVIREGAHTATAMFLVAKLSASFSPTSGNLATLKVRFRLVGWGRGGTVFLHYLNPRHGDRLNRNLGATQGPCGDLASGLLKLFPFTSTKGLWTLQFDKSSAYKMTSVPRAVIQYRIS